MIIKTQSLSTWNLDARREKRQHIISHKYIIMNSTKCHHGKRTEYQGMQR